MRIGVSGEILIEFIEFTNFVSIPYDRCLIGLVWKVPVYAVVACV